MSGHSELSPCPFCGGAADYCETSTWWVRCDDCGADSECDDNKETAAKFWNRRTPAPLFGQLVEALEVAMREACDLLAERTYGSPARSPGHNARLVLERALSAAAAAKEGRS